MAYEDYVARAQSAPSTPYGGGGGSFGSSSSKPEGKVYFGSTTPPPKPYTRGSNPRRQVGSAQIPDLTPGRGTKGRRVPGITPDLVTDERPESDARGEVMRWYGTPDFDKWGDHLVRLGLIDPEDARNVAVLDEWWQDVIDYAVKLRAAGKRLTPFQVAEALAATVGEDGEVGGRGGRGGSGARQPFSGTRSMRSTSVDLTDPNTAKAIVHDALSNYLGRRASDDEVSQFTSVINAAERANPTVTNSTTTYEDDIAVAQSAVTSGGITAAGRDQIIADQVMQKPEYGAYQAAALYFPVLEQAIGAVGN